MKDYSDLTKKYPNLYAYNKSITCGPGWYALIDELSSKLEKMIIELDLPKYDRPVATQIKEKYGTLRFYLSTETDEMSDAIEEADEKSETICEVCGKEGKLYDTGWYVVRCDKHKKGKQDEKEM